jgi:hypothetical protein
LDFIAIGREFGWTISGVVAFVVVCLTTIRVLAVRLEKAYQDQIAILKEAHTTQLKDIREGHAREIAEVRAYGERGWASSAEFQKQSERAVERVHDGANILRDLANEIYEERTRGRRTAER